MLLGPKPVFPSGSLYKNFPAKSSQFGTLRPTWKGSNQ